MSKITALMLSGLLLSACTSLMTTPDGDTLVFDEDKAVDRIRYSQLVSWHARHEGRLVIEVTSPKRQFRLALEPSCTFALRQAKEIRFSGSSRRYIAVGDDVVVGNNRCRITGMAPSQANPPMAAGFD
jgi:hypothetical protein